MLAAFLGLVLYPAGENTSDAPYKRTCGLTLLYLIFGLIVVHCGLRSGSRDMLCRMMPIRVLSWMGKYSCAIYSTD
jgi:hypothetical protein